MKYLYISLIAIIVAGFALIGHLANKPIASPDSEATTADIQEQDNVSNQISFGIYQTDKASAVFAKFQPVVRYLQESVTRQCSSSIKINLKIFKTYDQAREALVAGTIDFVRFGPASYVLASEENPGIQLLAMEQKKGSSRFYGLIIVRDDSNIQNINDLSGKRFAFGDHNSTIGRYLSQAVLVEHGLMAKDLSIYEYLGRHDLVVSAVRTGDFDAGAVKESTFNKLNKDGDLKVVARFENVTKPWIARQGLSPEIADAIRDGLINMTETSVLDILGTSGFIKAVPADYELVRSGMKASERFFD